MDKPTLPLPLLSFLLVFLFFKLGGHMKLANGIEQNTWCVANPSSPNSKLIANLDYACSQVDCSLIQQGNSCFYPNTYIHHASFAMNLYYQYSGGNSSSACDFRNSGLISLTDPSFGSCTYDSVITSEVQPEGQIMETWCVAKPSAENALLQENINFACNHVNCSIIQVSGSCYTPTTLLNHAALSMNLYYQNEGQRNSSCDFMGTGLIVTKDPSYANCSYQHSYYIH